MTDRVAGAVRVLPGNGDGTFGETLRYHAGSGPYGQNVAADGTTDLMSQEATAGVAIGAFRRGGPTGLAALDPGSNSFAILDGLGGAAFANPRRFFTSTPAQVVRTGDFNGDGVSDLALLSTSGVSVSLGNGQGGFFPPPTPDPISAGPDPSGLTVADVNHDGQLDLLVGNPFGDVLVLLGNGNGTFQPYRKTDQSVALAVAYLGNGTKALIFANQGLDHVVVDYGGVQQTFTGLLAPGAVTVTDPIHDLNNDRIPDLIVANSGSNNVLVYLGRGDGQFEPALNGGHGFFAGTNPVGISVADVNGDGRPDLVVANEGSNDISILLNQPQGNSITFTPGPRLKAGSGPVSTVVQDVNGDGIPDVLVSNSQSNNVMLLPGVGGGFFNDQNPTVFLVGISSGPVFVGDFTGCPAQLDLVTINAGSHTLTLNRNIYIDFRGGDAATLPEPVQGTGTLFVEIDLRGGDAAALLVAVRGDGRLAVFSIREFPVGGDGIDLRGDEAAALLVAESGDGHLALLQGGPEEPDLPNPTALAMDDLGRIFGVSEGIAVAVSVILGLGGGGEGSVIQGLPMVPNEQQVAQLQPLSRASLAVVATLHSTSVEMTSNEFAGPVSDPDGETDPIGAEISGMAVVIQESRNPVARFLSGLDEAFSRARIEARQGSLFTQLAHAEATEPKLRALDALLARWSPVLPQPAPLAAFQDDGRLDPLKPMAAESHRRMTIR